MNLSQIIPIISKGATGGLALFIVVKLANMLAPKVKAGSNWLSSTSTKGIIFKVAVGFVLLTIIPMVNGFVTKVTSRIPTA